MTPDASVPLNTTAHVAATFDGTNLSIYINGNLEGTGTLSSPGIYYGPEDVLIGAWNATPTYLRRFDGIVDEVRLWDHARGAIDIAATMNCRLDGDETGLLAYWRFDDGDLIDSTGNGNDGVAEDVGGAINFVEEVSLSGCQ